ELINQTFAHVDTLSPHVRDGHCDLTGPGGEIILPQVWEKLVQPGWQVTMNIERFRGHLSSPSLPHLCVRNPLLFERKFHYHQCLSSAEDGRFEWGNGNEINEWEYSSRLRIILNWLTRCRTGIRIVIRRRPEQPFVRPHVYGEVV
ncbi:hypothetical protein IWX50DRAFT_560773, partial [Phyllosticta citricarpa]